MKTINTVEQTHTKILQTVQWSCSPEQQCMPDNCIHTPMYSADSAILCILLPIFSQGIVDKKGTLFSLSQLYWVDRVVKAGKEFLNHVIGEEGHVSSCEIVWPSERTFSLIHICEQRGVVLQQMHMHEKLDKKQRGNTWWLLGHWSNPSYAV